MRLNEVFGEDCNLALGRKLQLSSFGNFFYESIFPSSILFPVFLTPYDEERNDFFFRFIFWYASFARGCRFHGWYSVGRHSQSKGYMKNNWLFFIISTYKPPSVVSSHSRDENDKGVGVFHVIHRALSQWLEGWLTSRLVCRSACISIVKLHCSITCLESQSLI